MLQGRTGELKRTQARERANGPHPLSRPSEVKDPPVGSPVKLQSMSPIMKKLAELEKQIAMKQMIDVPYDVPAPEDGEDKEEVRTGDMASFPSPRILELH